MVHFSGKARKMNHLSLLCERSEQRSIVILLMLFLASCVKENPVPAYLNIPSFTFTTNLGEGTAAQKISDVWVYVDGQSLGAYQIPARFPFVGTGKHEFLLFAGIRNNGIRSNPVIWASAETFSTTLDVKSGDDITIRPTSTYIDGIKFWLNEEFETTNTFTINRDNNAIIGFSPIANGFEGRCGSITLTKSYPIIEKATSVRAQLPDNAQTVLIELHYKTESPLEVGLVGYSTAAPNGETTYKIVLTPNKTWNKTYIDVTQEAKSLKSKDFQVVFRSQLPDTLTQATVLIDNVKLVQK
ncbi:MAG: hypothetical protein U5L45_17690 [Saprospiraceae bacterium]|nr:hypothetical protein [Saprospiraceae bacterium]